MKNPFLGIFQKIRPSDHEESHAFIADGTHGIPNLPVQDARSPQIDRVLSRALQEKLISEQDIRMWFSNRLSPPGTPKNSTLTWKQACVLDPWRSQQFERLAARVYGFRAILVCQMSTLVLADQLTAVVNPIMWGRMFELGLAPVVEHGKTPTIKDRVVCISKDPSSKNVRAFTNSIEAFQPELAYADSKVVSGMLDLIAQHVPAIGASVYVTRPSLQKVPVQPRSNRQAA